MIIRADARSLPLRDVCVDCCITSPPYFGLRDYGNRRQIGLEPTPAEFVAAIVDVFGELRRVLRDDGVVWLNLGDSYCNSDKWGGGGANTGKHTRTVDGEVPSWAGVRRKWAGLSDVKPKDLIGIPWRVAFALQADGWYLRSDVIWAKPNPMPESVTDRPTKAHEYLFLLTKSERYHYDAAAIAEPVSASMLQEVEQGYEGLGLKDYAAAGVQNPSSVKARIIASARRKNEQSGDRRKEGFNQRWADQEEMRNDSSRQNSQEGRGFPRDGMTRNRRTVWTIPTMPYAGAHFATMPEKLVEPCILAGCPVGGLVLDPFCGSGTVLAVAERLSRRSVGVDLSYQDLAKKRTRQRGLRFAAPPDVPECAQNDQETRDSLVRRSGDPDLDDESRILEELGRA